MATITPVPASIAGSALTYAAASAGGDTIATSGYSNVKLMVNNGGASSITVTLAGVQPCSQGATHDKTYDVAAGADEAITIPAQAINATNGQVGVTYSAVTSVTVAALAG